MVYCYTTWWKALLVLPFLFIGVSFSISSHRFHSSYLSSLLSFCFSVCLHLRMNARVSVCAWVHARARTHERDGWGELTLFNFSPSLHFLRTYISFSICIRFCIHLYLCVCVCLAPCFAISWNKRISIKK